ncbi:MAG: hypothetical protein MJK04_15900, partial [Psychrosphaera sp.]|nr:hypothetical protein [Psychrosphaera sp.]
AAKLNLETVAEGLNGPYDMIFDNGDMVVTTNEYLVKIKLTAEQATVGAYPVTNLAPVPDIALGVIRSGSEYHVLRNADRSLLKVTDGGDITVVAENLGAPIEIARQGKDFIVTDFGDPMDVTLNSRLLRISESGEVTVIAEAEPEVFELAAFAGIEVLGDTIWVTDFNLGRLLKISADGTVNEIARGLGHPVGIEFDGSDFIIADFGDAMEGKDNGRILRVSQNGELKVISKGRVKAVGNPSDIALLGADIYFSDIMAGRITKLSCGLCKRKFKR